MANTLTHSTSPQTVAIPMHKQDDLYLCDHIKPVGIAVDSEQDPNNHFIFVKYQSFVEKKETEERRMLCNGEYIRFYHPNDEDVGPAYFTAYQFDGANKTVALQTSNTFFQSFVHDSSFKFAHFNSIFQIVKYPKNENELPCADPISANNDDRYMMRHMPSGNFLGAYYTANQVMEGSR